MDPHLASLVNRLTYDLVDDNIDGDLFRLRLEREWRARLGLARELFGQEPELLVEELDHQLRDLWAIETWLADGERWELCAGVRDMRARIVEMLREAPRL